MSTQIQKNIETLLINANIQATTNIWNERRIYINLASKNCTYRGDYTYQLYFDLATNQLVSEHKKGTCTSEFLADVEKVEATITAEALAKDSTEDNNEEEVIETPFGFEITLPTLTGDHYRTIEAAQRIRHLFVKRLNDIKELYPELSDAQLAFLKDKCLAFFDQNDANRWTESKATETSPITGIMQTIGMGWK